MTTGQISIVIVVGEVRRLIFLGHSVKEAFCPVAFYPEALCPEFGNNNPVNRLFLSQTRLALVTPAELIPKIIHQS